MSNNVTVAASFAQAYVAHDVKYETVCLAGQCCFMSAYSEICVEGFGFRSLGNLLQFVC